METFYSTTLKSEMKQVNKVSAKKAYESGKTIYLQSSNMFFDNPWQHPFYCKNDGETSFESLCNNYRYYNCDAERGKYIHFYIKK